MIWWAPSFVGSALRGSDFLAHRSYVGVRDAMCAVAGGESRLEGTDGLGPRAQSTSYRRTTG